MKLFRHFFNRTRNFLFRRHQNYPRNCSVRSCFSFMKKKSFSFCSAKMERETNLISSTTFLLISHRWQPNEYHFKQFLRFISGPASFSWWHRKRALSRKMFSGVLLISIFNVSHYTTHYLPSYLGTKAPHKKQFKLYNWEFSTWNNKLVGKQFSSFPQFNYLAAHLPPALHFAVIYYNFAFLWRIHKELYTISWQMNVIWMISRYPQMHFKLQFIFTLGATFTWGK